MDPKEKIQLSIPELKELLTGITKAFVGEEIKRLGLDRVDRKFGNYPGSVIGMSDEDLTKMGKKEKVASFIKAVFHKDMATLTSKALSEGIDEDGGYLVPEEFALEVMRVIEDFGLVSKLARRVTLKKEKWNTNRLGSGVSVYYPGELGAITASQPTFARVILTAKKLAGITAQSNELLADADIDTVDLLVELFAEAIAGETDFQGLAGTGAPFTGLLTDTEVNVVTAATGEDTFAEAANPDNLRDMISQVKPWALGGSAYIMHRTVWGEIQKKKASTSGDYFVSVANPVLLPADAKTGFPLATAGTIWGYPVYLSDKMPALTATAPLTKFVIFGNLKHLIYGVRKDMAVDIGKEATVNGDNMFEQDMSAVRVIARHAIAIGLPDAFSVLKTNATP